MIVARAFAPAAPTWKYASTPFDPANSEHATHVAGIAAGDHDTIATSRRRHGPVSGIAPRAYLGNYKVLTVPTDELRARRQLARDRRRHRGRGRATAWT